MARCGLYFVTLLRRIYDKIETIYTFRTQHKNKWPRGGVRISRGNLFEIPRVASDVASFPAFNYLER